MESPSPWWGLVAAASGGVVAQVVNQWMIAGRERKARLIEDEVRRRQQAADRQRQTLAELQEAIAAAVHASVRRSLELWRIQPILDHAERSKTKATLPPDHFETTAAFREAQGRVVYLMSRVADARARDLAQEAFNRAEMARRVSIESPEYNAKAEPMYRAFYAAVDHVGGLIRGLDSVEPSPAPGTGGVSPGT